MNFYIKFAFSNKNVFSRNKDILNNFTRITQLERLNLIVFNSFKALTEPTKFLKIFINHKKCNYLNLHNFNVISGEYLSHLGDLVSYTALIDIKQKMMFIFLQNN